jgi:hypothetical protein
MWFDDLAPGKGWSSLWHHLSLCSCGAIQTGATCLVCEIKPDYTPIELLLFKAAPADRRSSCVTR